MHPIHNSPLCCFLSLVSLPGWFLALGMLQPQLWVSRDGRSLFVLVLLLSLDSCCCCFWCWWTCWGLRAHDSFSGCLSGFLWGFRSIMAVTFPSHLRFVLLKTYAVWGPPLFLGGLLWWRLVVCLLLPTNQLALGSQKSTPLHLVLFCHLLGLASLFSNFMGKVLGGRARMKGEQCVHHAVAKCWFPFFSSSILHLRPPLFLLSWKKKKDL